jgi:GT2 family glycosyltransferase/glycosyltransferase involved in cell wall biosynthesis
MEYSAELALEALQSPIVNDELFLRALGGRKDDIEAIRLYLRLPIAARPEVSWFFDRDFYLEKYPDIRRGEMDPLVHFLKWGVGESRSPHPLIDLRHIHAFCESSVLAEPLEGAQLYTLLSNDLADPSPFFSREYYRLQCSTRGIRPNPGLLLHFLRYGILHGLSPSPTIDVIGCYMQAGNGFDIRSGIREFVLRGEKASLDDSGLVPEWQTKGLFRGKARSLLPMFARQPLDFTMKGPPELSAIVVLHNQFALTLTALASLRDTFSGVIELVIVDSGSTDETVHLSQYVRGAVGVRFDDNIGFVRACSVGMEQVSGDYVLFLNNDIEFAHGAVDAALCRIVSDGKIGAVGAKIIRSDGRLQEAGSIIWRDGWTSGYLRDKSPLAPEANFSRDVEFCSLAFLMTRASVVREVGGFDLRFAPAYFEDADLCLRINRSGYRIVYDPRVVVFHLEYGSSESASDAHSQMQKSHAIFVDKHAHLLQENFNQSAGAELLARSIGPVRGRILFIEDQIPLSRLGSGFVRSNSIVKMLASFGYLVTLYPVRANHFDPAAIYADFPDTVEVIHDRSLSEFGGFILDREGYYDIIWICRTHNLSLLRSHLEAHCGKSRLILDTEAISAVRDWSHYIVEPSEEAFDLDANVQLELRDASACSVVVAVSNAEAEIIRSLGHTQVRTLGHFLSPHPTSRRFEDRSGMLFVGAIHTMDSPNYDSLCWFVDEVLPHIECLLGWETRLTIAGFAISDIDLGRFRSHARITILGAVTDLEPVYDQHRIFVAPTRFAAGLPYKLHEAASYGVPIVTTDLLCSQLGWENGVDLFAARSSDPEGFAALCAKLYCSQELWTSMRECAMKRLAADCDRSYYEVQLQAILGAD